MLSNKNTDSTYEQPWYKLGYTVKKVFNKTEFSLIKENIKNTLKKTLINQGISADNFELKNIIDMLKMMKIIIKSFLKQAIFLTMTLIIQLSIYMMI